MSTTLEPSSREYQRLTLCIHWMYGLQALGLGLALVSVAIALYPAQSIPWWFKVGVPFLLWPACIAKYLHYRNRRASLASPLLATHFEFSNVTFLSALVWLGALQLLYFVAVGLVVFNGAFVLIGIVVLLRTGWGWLMFNHGRPMRRKMAAVAKAREANGLRDE